MSKNTNTMIWVLKDEHPVVKDNLPVVKIHFPLPEGAPDSEARIAFLDKINNLGIAYGIDFSQVIVRSEVLYGGYVNINPAADVNSLGVRIDENGMVIINFGVKEIADWFAASFKFLIPEVPIDHEDKFINIPKEVYDVPEPQPDLIFSNFMYD